MATPARIVIADDHHLLRHALVQLLVQALGVEVVAQTADVQATVRACAAKHPDLLLLDVEMPGRDALGAIPDIQGVSPRTRIIILSAHCRDALISMALRADVSAYLVKTEPPSAIIDGVRSALRGERVYSDSVCSRFVADSKGKGRRIRAECRIDVLTAREAEVLRYIGKGMSNDQMAETMNLSKRTVERHVARLMDIVGIRDRAGLTRLAFESGVTI